jgi:TPR repeat protein
LEYYTLAAHQGNIDAHYNLGHCYQYGIGCEVNLKKAWELYQQAAEQGHADAQYMAGICCYQGMGVKRNRQQSWQYLEFAAMQGQKHALCALGICYQQGLLAVTVRDPIKALTYYRLAVMEGHRQAKALFDELLALQVNEGNDDGSVMSKSGSVYLDNNGSLENASTSSSDEEDLTVISDITFLEDDEF